MTVQNRRFDEVQSKTLNYVKGIGIILVVMGHYPGSPFDFYKIYMYHMPLFFFLGGVLLNSNKGVVQHYHGVIAKYAIYLLVMYSLVGFVAYLVAFFFPINTGHLTLGGPIESVVFTVKSNFHNNKYFLVAWFLFAYMLVLALAFPVVKVTSKSNKYLFNTFLLVSALLLGYYGMEWAALAYKASVKQKWNLLSQVMVGSSFFLLGHLVRNIIWKTLNLYVFVLTFLAMYVLVKAGYSHTSVMSWSRYQDGFIFSYAKALIGIYGVFFFANMIAKTGTYNLLSAAGESSKTVMSLHMLVFLMIDIIFYCFGMFDMKKSSPGNNYYDYYYWGLAIFSATFIPVLIHYGMHGCMRKIKERLQLN